MKLKTKSIIALMIALFAVLIIGTTKVDAYASAVAVVETGEIAENFTIPDTFNVDVKMSEIEKVPELIIEQLANQLSEQGVKIKISNYGEIAEKSYINISLASEKTMNIYVLGNNDKLITEKVVNVVYNNSNNYNENDKTSVENALKKLDKKNGVYQIEECIIELGEPFNVEQRSIQGLEKMLNDSSITFARGVGGGSGGQPPLFTAGSDAEYYIYKNGVYYTSIYTEIAIKTKITVPSNEDLETYATNKIKEYIADYNNYYSEDFGTTSFSKLEKISGDKYRVYYGEESDEIIIQQTKPTTSAVNKEDTSTGIKIETNSSVVSSNVQLVVNKVTEESTLNTVKTELKDISNKYTVFDISLLENNVKVQPNGKVKVSIPIPDGYDKTKLEIYRIDDNGAKTKYDVTVNGEYASFETDHFSTYVLAEKQGTETPATINNGEKDETPKTGIQDMTYIITAVATITAVGIIVTIKRKQSKH